jgi:hypothetical protein
MADQSPPEPDDLPEELIHLVKPELQPGERLLWASRAGAGSPSPGYRPSWAALTWFFGFAAVSVGCIVALPPMVNGNRDGAGAALAVIALVSGVIALFFIVGFLSTFFSRRSERRKLEGQVYALTDRRAIIWVPAERSAVSVHTFQRGTIKGEDLHRIQYPDGSGDVTFRFAYQQPSGFIGIAEVRRVEELVRRFLVVPGVPSPSLTNTPDPDLF